MTKRYRVVAPKDWPSDQPPFGIDFVLAAGELRAETDEVVTLSSADPSGHSAGLCGAKCGACQRVPDSRGWLIDQGFLQELV